MGALLRSFLLFLLLIPQAVFADWKDAFDEEADRQGVEVAVESALGDDMAVVDILSHVISARESYRVEEVLKALYCAGADRDEVREAANKLGINLEEVSKALEETIAECGSSMSLTDRDAGDLGPGGGEDGSVIVGSGGTGGVLEIPDIEPSTPVRP